MYKDSATGSGQYLNKIEIMDHVMIGALSVILPGVKIGTNAMVAGSVVVKDVPEGAAVGENPAKIIGTMDAFVAKRCEMFSQEPFKPRRSVDDIADFLWNCSR